MKQQHTQSSFGQGDWDRERNRNEMDPRTGAGSPEHGRPYPQSGPGAYPESHQQQQAQRDHPGIEYFSGSTGYGGRGDYPQQQGQGGFAQGYGQQQGNVGGSQQGQNYGGGAWSRSENEFRSQPGRHQQEAFQPGARQPGFSGNEDYGRYDRDEQQAYRSGGQQFGSSQYGQGQHRETQHSQYGRGSFEEEPFRQGGQQFQDSRMIDQQAQGYGQGFGRQQGQSLDQGRFQQEQFHGYGGRMSGQSNAGQSSQFGGHYGERQGQHSQGYGGFQGGQPQDYGNQQQSQYMGQGSHNTAQQPSGGYGSYGAYQVGSQPQQMGRGMPRPPKDYARSDERIRELICEHLAHHHAIDASDVSVQVKDGRVTLDGSVPDRRMKHEIEDVADGCWGVKDVDNRIRVGQGSQSVLGSAARGLGSAAADALTGGASTEAAQDMRTRPEDMSTTESSSSGMSATGRDAGTTTGAPGTSTTIASGRKTGAESRPNKGK